MIVRHLAPVVLSIVMDGWMDERTLPDRNSQVAGNHSHKVKAERICWYLRRMCNSFSTWVSERCYCEMAWTTLSDLDYTVSRCGLKI